MRTYEVTVGPEHGWHPHIHAPLFVDRKLEPQELEELRQWVTERLNKRYRSWYRDEHGELKRWPMNRKVPAWFSPVFDRLHPERGVTVTGGQNAAGYVAKMGLSREISGFMEKGAREENRTMFQVLLHCYLTENPEDWRLFREYAEAVTGKSRWHWTPDYMKRLFGEEEDTEEEVPDEADELQEEWERLQEADRRICFQFYANIWDHLSWRMGTCGMRSKLLQVYNAGGLERLRSFVQAQFDKTKGGSKRVLLDRERRLLWVKK